MQRGTVIGKVKALFSSKLYMCAISPQVRLAKPGTGTSYARADNLLVPFRSISSEN